MKKLFLLTAVSLTCLNFNAEAMEPEEKNPSPPKQAAKLSPISAKLPLNREVPITTGFFDRTLIDTTIDTEEKCNRALTHVTARREKYELFLGQIGATYFRTKFLQDETLNNYAVLIMSYFEEKLERLEKKYIHFQAYLEDVSQFTQERNTANAIGIYSGKHRGDQVAQADYAYTKIKIWDILFSFVDQFPVTKVSTSPIIQRAIEEQAQKRVNEFGKLQIIRPESIENLQPSSQYYLKTDIKNSISPAKQDIDRVAKRNPVCKLNDIIDNSYDLKIYSEEHLKKWRTRIGEKQKINILGDLLKSFKVTNNELEEGIHEKPLALEWAKDPSSSAGR